MRFRFLGLAVAAVIVAGACGGSHTGFSDLDAGDDAGAPLADAPSFGDSAPSEPDGPPCNGTRCSADLHDVIDCKTNTVTTTCPADQGCANGGCVPACASAQANKSHIGCDYYGVVPDVHPPYRGSCYAMFVANTWNAPITLGVERQGTPLDVTAFAVLPSGNGNAMTYGPLPAGGLDPGKVAILFLSARAGQPASGDIWIGCPKGITAAVVGDASASGTAIGDAFHVTTSAPVAVYDMFPYGGGAGALTGASLLLPTSAWDKNYVVVSPFPAGNIGIPSMDVVAQEDGTTVTILPKWNILGGPGVAAASQNTPQTYALNKGQVLQITQPYELTGSPIQSDKPVALWGSQTCLYVGQNDQACDSAHQQIPPVAALGREYAAVRYRDRKDGQSETPPWRIVGAVDGTTLTYEPSRPTGAPTTIKSGEAVIFNAAGPFTVRGQDANHPFYVAAYMEGCEHYFTPHKDCRGDPEFVNAVPAEQYLDKYVFFTDPTYPEASLVVVRRKGSNGFADVTLDCAGALGGWQALGTSGTLQYTHVDLVRHDFEKQGNCDNGLHDIHSDAPFGVTVWGWGSGESATFSEYVSYAYPAGSGVNSINSVVVPIR
jgi:hypothetical protein